MPESSAEINKIENVLLKAGSAKAHRSLKELRSDAGVGADRTRDLVNVGARRFAKRGNRVDRGNALRKKRIGDELGKLGGPKIRRQDALAWNPPRINRHQLLDGGEAFRRLFAANQNAIRILQILHRRALCEKLGIREHLVIELLSARTQDRQDRFRGFHRNGALLNDDLWLIHHRRNHAGDGFDEAHIGGAPGANTKGLGRRVDTDKNNIRAPNGILHSGREKQIPASSGFYDLVQTRAHTPEGCRNSKRRFAAWLRSTTSTRMSGHFAAIIAMVGPPT